MILDVAVSKWEWNGMFGGESSLSVGTFHFTSIVVLTPYRHDEIAMLTAAGSFL